MMAAEVSRGSQVHQVFQMGRAQMAPLTRLTSASVRPTSTPATAKES